MEAKIEHFKWDEEPAANYFTLYFTRFERLMRLKGVMVADAESDCDINTIVVDTLMTVGGNELLQRIMEIDKFDSLTYAAVKAKLEREYMCKNIKLNEFKFHKMVPEPDEKLKDYVRRLKITAKTAGITEERIILMQILCTTTSTLVRNKIMHKDTTLQVLLDWQETNDIVVDMSADENRINSIKSHATPSRVAHVKNVSANYKPNNIIQDENSNKTTLKVTGLCFYCNETFPHQNQCPAKNERCDYCNKLGHRLICCFQRMQLILNHQNQIKEGRLSRFKQTQPQQHQPTNNTNLSHRNSNVAGNDNSHYHPKSTPKTPTHKHVSKPNDKPVSKVNQVISNQEDNDSEYECDNEDCPCCTIRQSQITSTCQKQRKRPVIEINLNGTNTKVLLDSGADIDTCSKSTYEKALRQPKLMPSSMRYKPFNSKISLKTMGYFRTLIKINGIQRRIQMYVIDDTSNVVENILCFDTITALKLITVNVATINATKRDTISQIRIDFEKRMRTTYPECWENRIGLVPGVKIHLDVNENILPTQGVPFDIAYSLIPGSEKKLDFLASQKVTRPVPPGTHHGWISPLRVVPKDGTDKDGHQNVRVTINSIKLNQAVIKTKRVMPHTKKILRSLNGKKFFSKLDIKDAFHTIELDEESQKYTVFSTNTHGLLAQTRLWMGLCVSSELYNEVMEEKMRGLIDFTQAIDDMMVASIDLNLCMQRTEEAIKRISELNLTLSDKCKFLQTEIEFWGWYVDQNGTRPTTKKLDALRESPVPTNAKETLSFICFATYFMDRIPYLSTVCDPLRDLAYSKNEFKWTNAHDQAFEQIKTTIIDRCLGHFDEKFATELWVDASPMGCGAFLMQIQNNKRVLIACASKTHTQSESNYSHIEKECKACVWACNKFKTYLLGKDFTLLTDNKSVALILDPSYDLKKQTTLRLGNWKSELVQFSRMVVNQITGEQNIADYLSRCIASPNTNDTVPTSTLFKMNEIANLDDDYNVASVQHYLKAITLDEIAKATEKDIALKIVKGSLLKNHSVLAKSNNALLNKETQHYRLIFDELSMSKEGCILHDDKIIIPDDLRQKIIELTHEAHMGINSCKRLIRDNYWFKNIDKMVKDHCDYCVPCQANTDVSEFNPLQVSMPTPKKNYRLCADFTSKSPNGDHNLVVVDAYTRMPYFITTKHLTADAVIAALKKLFREIGVPKEILSDNGPAFKSNDYARFLASLNIKRLLITPEWPRGNPTAERMMKNINRVIRCSLVAKKPYKRALDIYLNNYRATPHSSTKFSPNEMMGLPNKLKMPSLKRIKDIPQLTAMANDMKAKATQKMYGDKHLHAKQVTFNVNEKVLVKYNDSIKPRIKSSKYKSLYDPDHYVISDIKGTMITAKRPQHTITRNCYFFRHFLQKTSPIKQPIVIQPMLEYTVMTGTADWDTEKLREFLKKKRLEAAAKAAQIEQDKQLAITIAKELNKQQETQLQADRNIAESLNKNQLKQNEQYEEHLINLYKQQHKLNEQINLIKSKQNNKLPVKSTLLPFQAYANVSTTEMTKRVSIGNDSVYFDVNSTRVENEIDTPIDNSKLKQPIQHKLQTNRTESLSPILENTTPSGSGNSVNDNRLLAKQNRLKNSEAIIKQYTLLMADYKTRTLESTAAEADTAHNVTGEQETETKQNLIDFTDDETHLSQKDESNECNVSTTSEIEQPTSSRTRVNQSSGKISKQKLKQAIPVKNKPGRKPGSKNSKTSKTTTKSQTTTSTSPKYGLRIRKGAC
jgi:hypothetical protein